MRKAVVLLIASLGIKQQDKSRDTLVRSKTGGYNFFTATNGVITQKYCLVYRHGVPKKYMLIFFGH